MEKKKRNGNDAGNARKHGETGFFFQRGIRVGKNKDEGEQNLGRREGTEKQIRRDRSNTRAHTKRGKKKSLKTASKHATAAIYIVESERRVQNKKKTREGSTE